jgi:multidrug resistance efflux pump
LGFTGKQYRQISIHSADQVDEILRLLLLVGLFIPMEWGAPRGSAVVIRNSVQIVPDVAGQVIDVPVEPNAPIKAGDILFCIDPVTVTFEAQARTLEAQLNFQELRLSQLTQLQSTGTGRSFDVEQR